MRVCLRFGRRHRPVRRQGVLLLIVVSLLVLFALMGLTFVVVASHHQKAAKSASRRNRVADDAKKLAGAVVHQLLRDVPEGSSSSLAGHSLLRDLYGSESLAARVTRAAATAGGQFLKIEFETSDFPRTNEFYSGSVLTMVTGGVAGVSTRVVDYSAGERGLNPYVEVECFRGPRAATAIPIPGDTFLINGRPFNGTGHGYNSSSGRLDQTVDGASVESGGIPVALLPNFSAYANDYRGIPGPRVEDGGADESWDAVDYQNLFLAKLSTETGGAVRQLIVPSFHRPALVRYWKTTKPDAWSDPEFRRRVILRPLLDFHPRFTGSNPSFDPVAGPWDVDNDGDGIPDSIWVDVGFPPSSTADGRWYKPLAAILCVDLDGRLNVNAHGNLAQLADEFARKLFPMPAIPGLEAPTHVPRGQGTGPAEISLQPLFSNTKGYEAFLVSRYSSPRESVPGTLGDDFLSSIKNIGLPSNYANQWLASPPGKGSFYATPPDLFGRRQTFLDRAGHPFASFQSMPFVDENVDDPYEINLVEPNGCDRVYTFAELERVLRSFDTDAHSLPDRLSRHFGSATSTADAKWPRILTSASFEIPVPNVLPPQPMRRWANPSRPSQQRMPPPSVMDVMAAKLHQNNVDPGQIQRQLEWMLPAELRQGQRMDINRLVGNGRDDGGVQGVVDDHFERLEGEQLHEWRQPYGENGPAASFIDAMAPQIYARELYCLLRMLMDEEFTIPTIERAAARQLTTQRIAQWAVNAVDFRDPDAIMTSFEYDLDPFDGWDVDGLLETNEGPHRAVVWGCEYPHLLLTETLAFHDLRAKDLATEQNDPTGGQPARRHEPAPGTQQDDDLDQYRMPQGNAFFELYCTGNPHRGRAGEAGQNETLPRELYSRDTDGQWKLDLARVVPSARDSGPPSPVWRLAISARHAEESDSVSARLFAAPDSLTLQPELDGIPIERIVLFTDQCLLASQKPAFAGLAVAGCFYNKAGMPALLAPKQYAVVGSRPVTVIGSNLDGEASGNEIRLNVGSQSNSVEVVVPHGEIYPQSGPEMKRPLSIIAVMDMDLQRTGWQRAAYQAAFPTIGSGTYPKAIGVGLNVSEPLPHSSDFYPAPNWRIDGQSVQDAYSPALDKPLDGRPGSPLGQDSLAAAGTRRNYRTAFLQRLADPTRTFHPHTNPYVTVDWLPIDLTVFNGEQRKPNDWPAGEGWVVRDLQSIDQTVRFSTRERGLTSENIWRAFSIDPQQTLEPKDGADDLYFRHRLDHSLGYLNRRSFGSGLRRIKDYEGDPQQPFPWMTWNDRPFSNAYELLFVPSVSAPRLLWEFSFPSSGSAADVDPYAVDDPKTIGQATAFRSPYGHLFNFFQSSNRQGSGANFSRLLDYVGVPSKFLGTETWYNPEIFSQRAALRPPFNRLSRFRDPGRVNINTIHDERVWNAVSAHQVSWSKLQASRGPVDDPSLPTYYPRPFRSAASADLMPLPQLEQTTSEATLLRSDPEDGATPLFVQRSSDAFRDTDKNPYFRYQTLQRLGGVVTNHSNVFAVWVSIGYFEVDQNPGGIDGAHPDGYRLATELDCETGGATRHRVFFIIDRSLPVAFEPGQNHNVGHAIVLRRFIE